MRRLLVIYALVGVVGTAAAFRGQGSLPGPAGQLTPVSVMWTAPMYLFATQHTDRVYAQFKTGAASTATNIYFSEYQHTAAGTGSGTFDLTDTSGTALCTVTIACASAAEGYTATNTCTAALAASTVYQVRGKAVCAGAINGFGTVHVAVTTP